MTARTSSSPSGSRVSSSDRDSSGPTTEKNGFSVVAPMNETQRFSTAGSSASCWALLNRCTSSMNSTVNKADRKSTRLNSSHQIISYAVFCLKKKKMQYDVNHL